jgi:putative transposase
MSRKYKFRDLRSLYFVTFAVVYWIDVFTRSEYKDTLLDAFRTCQEKKGLEIYSYCIMPNHVHMIIGSNQEPLPAIMRDLKGFSSKQLIKQIQSHPGESRKEWMLDLMAKAGEKNSNNTKFQFWLQHNKPIELNNNAIMDQKLAYIHNNPVVAGFTDREEAWLYSSARDYQGEKGLLDIQFID